MSVANMAINGVYKINGDVPPPLPPNTVPLQEVTVTQEPHQQPPPQKYHAPLERQDSAFGIITPMTLTFQHIDVFSKVQKSKLSFKKAGQQKHILKDVSGEVRPGQLLAIIGASGAGKTTLLNVLTGRSSNKLQITGNILVNNKKVGKSIVRMSSYVQQQDLFMGTLTVKEHLTFQALLRMEKDCSYRTRMERVEQALIELGLMKCAKTKIGIPGRIKGISGGEMKRLTFASEVLTNPCLMFCDEPTSGLDAYMAHSVVSVLRKMTAEGRTIVCTIHQPASDTYSMFDQILLMAEGRVAYMGPRREALDFLASVNIVCPQNYNPADYFIDQLAVVPGKEEVCRDRIRNVCDSFQSNEYCYKSPPLTDAELHIYGGDDKHESAYKTSSFTQFRVLVKRSFIVVLREKALTAARILQTVVLAALIALIFKGQRYDQKSIQNINGALFIILTNMTFQNIMTILAVFGQELNVFLREHTNGMYRPSIYFISKTLAEAPIFTLIPILYVTIIYWSIGFYFTTEAFFICLSVSILVSNIACSYAYMVSSLFSNPALVAAFGYPLMFPLMLLGGFYLNHDTVPVYFDWMKYLSWFYYGNEALLINQWQHVTYLSCENNTDMACLHNGLEVLGKFDFKVENFQFDVGMMIVLLVSFRVLATIGLVFKVKSK